METEKKSLAAPLIAALKKRGTSRWVRFAGLAILAIGAIWAVVSLDLTWSSLSLFHLAVNFLVLTPAMLGLAALSLKITCRAVGGRISNASALQTVATANVAELLPLPGGALVRGAALINMGTSVAVATSVVLLTSMLTLCLTVTVSALALSALGHLLGLWGGAATLIGVLLVLVFLAKYASLQYLLGMVVVRLLSIAMTVLRLIAAFATLGADIGWIEGALYSAAPTLGAAVGIVPAGLGVNEAIAAGLATMISASPETAFLAVALNRALGLAVGGGIVLASSYLKWRK